MKPNILLILCNSLAPHFTEPYGDPMGVTPNLGALASRGTIFDDAYCAYPLCAPSRASLVTGRYASELGCFDNGSPFAAESPTLGHALSATGHETAIIVKMHFVRHDQFHSFDERIALETDAIADGLQQTPLLLLGNLAHCPDQDDQVEPQHV